MMQFHSKAMLFGPIVVITTGSPLPSAEVGAAYSTSIGASGGVGPYTFVLTSGSMPAGLNLASNGLISGTPTTVQVMFPNISATDSLGHQSQPKAFSMTVVSAVSITTTSPLPNATQSTAYSFTMSATGGVTPYVWSLLSQTGSNGWSVSPSGVVSGTPSTIETDTLDIQVVDALGVPSAANFNLTVNSGAANGPAIFTTGIVSALPNSVAGTAYSYQLVPSFGVGPYTTYALIDQSGDQVSSTVGSAHALANTFALSGSGVLTCASISATAENNYFLVSYVDSTSTTYEQHFCCLNGANALKIVTPANLGFITQGNSYTLASPLATLKAVGNAGALTWSLVGGPIAGFSYPFTTNTGNGNTWAIDASTGKITGTATNTGYNSLAVQVTDGTNTTIEIYTIGVFDVVTGATRPSYNPSSGVNSLGIPCGPGFYVRPNGELYEPNGTLWRQVGGSNNEYGDIHLFSNPWMDSLNYSCARVFLAGAGGTTATLATLPNYLTFYNTNWLGTHRPIDFVMGYDFSGYTVSGSSVLGTSTGNNNVGMGTLLQNWVSAYSLFAPYLNKIQITIANEYGPYSDWSSQCQDVYAAVSAPITGLTGTTLTFSGASPFNATNAGGGIGQVYIKGATWSGANNDGLYAVSANGTNTLTGTFPSGYVSGGQVWAGAIGVMRAAGFYCPLVIDSSGGQGYVPIVNYGAAIATSDPLRSIIFSYHLYSNQDNNITQTAFENGTGASTGLYNPRGTGILTPLNALRNSVGCAVVMDETGIYGPDQGGSSGNGAQGGWQTAFPSSQQNQSCLKYGMPTFHWISNSVAPQSDTNGGAIQGMRYNNSSSQSSATNAGYPSQATSFMKHTFFDPIHGSLVNFTGYATSF